jgi:hypothetical protein
MLLRLSLVAPLRARRGFAASSRALLLALALASTTAAAQRLAPDAKLPPEVRSLSDRLALFQRILDHEHGIKQIFVGGGSSRGVLDAVYFGKPLSARDIDVFAVRGRKVTRAWAGGVAAELQGASPVPLALSDLEPRIRGNGRLAGAAASRYVAGHGFFLKEPGGDIFDLSIYHTPYDLGLNGLLNIDTVMIPLASGETLAQRLEKLRGISYARAVREGLVVDDHAGYRGWQRNRLRVVHPDELRSKPALSSMRLARSFGKAGYQRLPHEVARTLREGEARFRARPPLKLVTRYLARILNDPRADRELKMVKQAGVLEQHAGVRKLLGPPASWTPEKLRARLEKKP